MMGCYEPCWNSGAHPPSMVTYLIYVLREKEHFLKFNLLCPFTSVKSCPLDDLPVLILKNIFRSIFSTPFNILKTSTWSPPLNLRVSMQCCYTTFLQRFFIVKISKLWKEFSCSPLFCSSMSMSFLRYALHSCIQYSKWALYWGTINPLSLCVIFLRTF